MLILFVSALLFGPTWHDIAIRNARFTSIAHDLKQAEISCSEPHNHYSRCSAKTESELVFMSCSTTEYGFCYASWTKYLLE